MRHRWMPIVAHAVAVAALAAPPAIRAQDATASADPVEARFRSVASHLDLGGDVYFYLNLEDLIEQTMKTGRAFLASLPDEEQAAMVAEKLAAADVALRESGIYNIASIGISSKPAPDGLNRIKSFLGIDRYLEQGDLWKVFGGAPDELSIAGYAPEGAALLRAVNLDPEAGWDWVRGVLGRVGGEEMLGALDQKIAQAKEAGGIDADRLIRSIGDGLLVSGYLDPETMITLPIGAAKTEMPAPSVLIALAVKDRTLPDLLQSQLSAQGTLLTTQVVDGVETVQVPNPFPLPIPLQPAMAVQDGVMLIASTPDLLRRALAAGTGTGRFVDSETYARVFNRLPKAVNGMAYVDPAVSELVVSVQLAGMAGNPSTPPAAREAMKKWMEVFAHAEGAAVRVNLPDGILFDSVSSAAGRQQVALMLTVIPAGLGAAILLPAFAQARTHGGGSTCTAHLRMIDAAKQMYALEHDLHDGDPPPPDGLTPFFPDGLPVCPEGGAYTPGPIGTPPSCSVHGPLAAE